MMRAETAPPYTKSINYLQPKSLNVENVKISMGTMENQRRLYRELKERGDYYYAFRANTLG